MIISHFSIEGGKPETWPGIGLQLILQPSDAVEEWPQDQYVEKKARNALRLAIQDSRSFPSLNENLVQLDEGYSHRILVRASNTYVEYIESPTVPTR